MTQPQFFKSSDGVQLAVRQMGPLGGRPLLFVHGFMGGPLTWEALQRGSLAKEFRLIFAELRGHGDSDKPVDPAAYGQEQLWANDLSAVVEGLDLQDFVLVAHSYGGTVAMDYLRHAQTQRIGALFLVAAAAEPPGCDPTLMNPAAFELLHPLLGAGLPQRVDIVRAFVRSLTAKPTDQDVFERLLSQAMASSPAMVTGAFSRPPRSNAEVLAGLKCPVAFLLGDHENVVTPAMSAFVKRHAPQTQELVYAGVGHLPQLEAPEAFADDLARFARV